MTVEIRGTADPDSIAAVLALLQRLFGPAGPSPSGTAAWRARRRAALARPAGPSRH